MAEGANLSMSPAEAPPKVENYAEIEGRPIPQEVELAGTRLLFRKTEAGQYDPHVILSPEPTASPNGMTPKHILL